MKFQPKKAEPSSAERKSFGARLGRAENLMREGKPLKIDAPVWAAEEVATAIPHLRYYAKTGMIQGSDTQNPFTYIRPDDIAYEVWQAALSFKGRISKRTGDGAKFLRDADAPFLRAKSSEAQLFGVCQEIRYAYVAGYARILLRINQGFLECVSTF